MAKGWHREPRRHALARRGIKTAIDDKPINRVPIKKHSYSVIFKGGHWVKNNLGETEYIEERISVPVASEEAGKTYISSLTPTARNSAIIIKDSDGDGMPDNLDCDPNDPNKQGFFDNLKNKVSETISGVPDDVKLRRLRAKLEEKEELLEAKKERKLLELDSQVQEKKAVAEIKAKEKELDRIQSELEEGSFKQRLKTGLITGAKKAFIIGKKVAKRASEELAAEDPKKFTEVTLTEEEASRTSNATQNKLSKQRKQNAELEAKIELDKLRKQEKELKKQLSSVTKNKAARKKKKKKEGLFSI